MVRRVPLSFAVARVVVRAVVWTAVGALPVLARAEPAAPVSAAPVLTRAPELTKFVEAAYPDAARQEGRTGTVRLALTIDAAGHVSDPQVVQSAGPDLDAAALAAVQQFVFTPAEVDGAPGAVRITYDYTFTLEKQIEVVAAPTTRPTGALRGRLLQAGTRAPLAGITVRISGVPEPTFTDAEGRYAFPEVPAGDVKITVSDPLYAEIEDKETITAGEATEVTYYLEKTGFEDTLTVVGRRPQKQVVRRTLTIQEIRTLPGTQGDALKVIQNLPGVARQVFSDELVLRGGGRSQAYVDGHPIPVAFHFGGIRSTVSSGLIDNIDLYPGNFSPEFGRVTGGVIDVTLRDPKTDGLHGFAEADFFDAGFLLEGPLTDHWSFAVAGRRSYIDALLPLVLDAETLGNFTTAPRYYDGQLLMVGKYGRHTVRALGLFSSDLLQVLLPREGEQSAGFDFGQDWAGARLAWQFRADAQTSNELSLSFLQSESGFGADFGGQPIRLDVVERRITLRDTFKHRFDEALELRVGTDSELLLADFGGYMPPPPKEGEPDSGAPNDDTFVEVDGGATALSPGLWSDLEIRLGRFTLLPGVRLDYFAGPAQVLAQPRATVRYQVAENTVVKGAAGLYAQPPTPDEQTEEFGNPDVEAETSLHFSFGFEQRLSEALSIDCLGFYKTLDHLVVQADDPEVQVTNQGEGRAYGLEVLLRHDLTDRLFGWIAYTLQRSERRDGPGESVRPFDLDQTHNLTVVGQYKLTPTWEVGLRFRYVTGNPTTPVVGADYDADEGGYVPRYGAINSGRLGAFHQLDLRVDKHWIFDMWRLTAYLDVQNVYNRENPEGIEYRFDYRQSVVQAGLPIVPSLGLRGEF